MKCEWKKIFVSDLGKIVTGKTPKTSMNEYYGGKTPFLTPSDDMSVKYIRKTNKYITEQGKDSVKNSIIPKNSICVSCIGSDLGKVVITTEETVTNQQINSVVVDKEKYDVDFIYYSMCLLGKILNYHSKTSTAVPIINKSSFSKYQISCPNLLEQKKIACILSSIDDKIELNNAINKNLEDQVSSIYVKTFSKIIEPISDLGSIIDIKDGTHTSPKPQKEGYYLITSKHLLEYGVNRTSASLISYQDFENINRRSLVCKYDVLMSMIGTVGNVSLVCDDNVDFAIKNVALFKTSKAKNLLYYFLCYLKSDKTQQYIEMCLAGSTQKYISLGELRKMPIVKPDEHILSIFNKTVEPLFKQIILNNQENLQLSSLRDTLLPKLMSGEIDVSDIEI